MRHSTRAGEQDSTNFKLVYTGSQEVRLRQRNSIDEQGCTSDNENNLHRI